MHSVTETVSNRRKDKGIMSSYEDIKKNEEILAYLKKADKNRPLITYRHIRVFDTCILVTL